MEYILENSPTPIYQRLVMRVYEALLNLGKSAHLVNQMDPQTTLSFYKNIPSYASRICIVVTNIHHSVLQKIALNEFVFSALNCRIVHIHHDPFSFYETGSEELCHFVNSLREVSDRYYHISFEPRDVDQLSRIGLSILYHNHIYSLVPRGIHENLDFSARNTPEVSFVGHVSPNPLESAAHQITGSFKELYLHKVGNFAQPVRPFFSSPANSSTSLQEAITQIATEMNLVRQFGIFTNSMRLQVLHSLSPFVTLLYGGLPGIAVRSQHHLFAPLPHVRLRPAVWADELVSTVYTRSLVVVNATTFGIDYAVTNRVYDVIVSGGLPLTDLKEECLALGDAFVSISYNSLDELVDLTGKFCSRVSRAERARLINSLKRVVIERCSPKSLAQKVSLLLD